MLYYQIDEFAYDLNNDEILKYKICTRESVPEDEFYIEYSFKIKNTSTNKYEKMTINNNTYLRITLGQNAIELQDLTNS